MQMSLFDGTKDFYFQKPIRLIIKERLKDGNTK